MFHFKKQAPTDNICAPIGGQVVELTTVSDPVFAQKMMGDGFAIKPDTSTAEIVAPIDGEVTVAQGHALGVRRADGLEFLVHIGIDTVNLQGAPFELQIKQGKRVHAGEPVIKVDWAMIKAHKLDNTVMVLITNSKTDLDQLQVNYQEVAPGEIVGTASAIKKGAK